VKGTKTQRSKKERKESKNPDTTGRPRGYDRGNSAVPGERECKRKGRRGKTGNVWKERKEGGECAMRREKETIEHMDVAK
jgi:hypothetical protein